MEQASVSAEHISTQNAEPLAGKSWENKRDLGDGSDDVEAEADAGVNGRRGSMDYQGIFTAALIKIYSHILLKCAYFYK